MKTFIFLLLSSIQFATGQTYVLTGTKNTITINLADPSMYWNGNPDRFNELVYTQELRNGQSLYYEITDGKRTGRLAIGPIDSTSGYSVGSYQRLSDGKLFQLVSNGYDAVIGRWNITMNVLESDCPDSYSGMIRTEIWHISGNAYDMRVRVVDNGGQTISSYKGEFDGAYLRLNATISGLFTTKAKGRIILLLENGRKLSGTRWVNRNDPCAIRSSVIARRL